MASIKNLREQVADLRKELATAIYEEDQPTIVLCWGRTPKPTPEEARKQLAEDLKIRQHIATYGPGSVKMEFGGIYMEDGSLIRPDGSVDRSKQTKQPTDIKASDKQQDNVRLLPQKLV